MRLGYLEGQGNLVMEMSVETTTVLFRVQGQGDLDSNGVATVSFKI